MHAAASECTVGMCTSCGRAFGRGRGISILLNIGRRRRACTNSALCLAGVLSPCVLGPRLIRSMATGASDGCRRRMTSETLFNHVVCGCVDGCLVRISTHCSNDSGFPGGSHFRFFPAISLK